MIKLQKPTIGEVFQAVVWFLTVLGMLVYDHQKVQAAEEKLREHDQRIVSFEKSGSQGLATHIVMDDQRDVEMQRRVGIAEAQISALLQNASKTQAQFEELLRRLPPPKP